MFTVALLYAIAALQERQEPRQVPIRSLTSATAQTTNTVGSVFGLRELPDGRIVVNDPVRRQLILFEKNLTAFTPIIDSAGHNGNHFPQYGTRALFPFFGDSTLFVDNDARVFLVIDPGGRVARAMAHPKSSDFANMNASYAGAAGVDARIGFIYQGGRVAVPVSSAAQSGVTPPPRSRDTLAIVRADLETRVIDTLATMIVPRATAIQTTTSGNGKKTGSVVLNPVPGAADAWAVLSDGSLAVVRAQDYHIDWVYADGSRASTPKMLYDWRRLTDEDKLAKIDSIRRVIDSMSANGTPYGRMIQSQTDASGTRTDTIIPKVDFTPLKEIGDYVPPIRSGALKADRDGNLWILPTTSLQAKNGLLYDVVSRKGQVVERVQLPPNRDIAGFGRGGVVYLMWLRGPDTYTLERVRVAR